MIEPNNRTFVCYLDDNDEQVSGFVELIEINNTFVKFATNKNIVTIPMNRILKIKEEKNGKRI